MEIIIFPLRSPISRQDEEEEEEERKVELQCVSKKR